MDRACNVLRIMRARVAASTTLWIALALCAPGFAQTTPGDASTSSSTARTVTLTEAIALAKARNGTLLSAVFDVQAARARVNQTESPFLPNVATTVRYNNSRQETFSQQFNQKFAFGVVETRGSLDASWRIFDTGERRLDLSASNASLRATELTRVDTLRDLLFDLQSQYYNTLRAQELQRVADAQVTRTDAVLRQTEARVREGDAPRKDVLQARADALNAQVNVLTSRNRTATTLANFKATIGWSPSEGEIALEAISYDRTFPEVPAYATLVEEGVKIRPDLLAQRKRLDALRFGVRRAELDAGLTVTGDLTAGWEFTPDNLQSRGLTILLNYPLFDGARLRNIVREQRSTLKSNEALYTQAERTARAEIEGAYIEYTQNVQRVAASQAALEAARVNFQAADGAQRAGAADLIEVLTAQVSLVTAETNYIEAIFDTLISELRLAQVTGRPLPGE